MCNPICVCGGDKRTRSALFHTHLAKLQGKSLTSWDWPTGRLQVAQGCNCALCVVHKSHHLPWRQGQPRSHHPGNGVGELMQVRAKAHSCRPLLASADIILEQQRTCAGAQSGQPSPSSATGGVHIAPSSRQPAWLGSQAELSLTCKTCRSQSDRLSQLRRLSTGSQPVHACLACVQQGSLSPIWLLCEQPGGLSVAAAPQNSLRLAMAGDRVHVTNPPS